MIALVQVIRLRGPPELASEPLFEDPTSMVRAIRMHDLGLVALGDKHKALHCKNRNGLDTCSCIDLLSRDLVGEGELEWRIHCVARPGHFL
jgi:hypothetical protein